MEALKGKVAVVTGASEGIGDAIVRRLAAEGMKVAALARRLENLKKLETDLKGKGYIVKGYTCDVQIESDVKASFRSIEEDFGAVSVLVNNDGLLKVIPIRDIKLDDVSTVMNTNVVGLLSCTKAGLPLMKTEEPGHIININSVAGHRTIPVEEYSVYSASKHAVTVLTNSLKNELKSTKIRVRNGKSISPGLVKTAMTKFHIESNAIELYLEPSNIADAVIYALTAPSNVNVSEIILDPK